jgi:hypothetical protein
MWAVMKYELNKHGVFNLQFHSSEYRGLGKKIRNLGCLTNRTWKRFFFKYINQNNFKLFEQQSDKRRHFFGGNRLIRLFVNNNARSCLVDRFRY